VWGLVVIGLVPTMTLALRNRSLGEDPWFIPIAVIMILGYATVGALLGSRTSRNPIGHLLLAVGTAFLLTGLSDEYLQWVEATGGARTTFVGLIALLTTFLWLPMIAVISLLMLLFPSGTVPGRRWRPLPWLIGGAIVTFLLGSILTPGVLDAEDTGISGVANPLGVEALRSIGPILAGIGSIAVLLCVPLALASPIVRYRRASGEERQQIRWLAYVVGAIAALVVIQVAIGFLPGEGRIETLVIGFLFLITFTLVGIGVPVTIAVAVLRFRLYELDVVVKKTVVFGLVVVLLTVAFLVIAAIAGGLVGRTTGAAVAVAFVVGALLVPMWRVARTIADRVVYGGRTTPYEALTEFSDRLSEAYATDDVLPRMAAVLGESTRAATATVWVRVGNAFRASAGWPGDATLPAPVPAVDDELPALPGDRAVEIRHRGELLGALTVVSRPDDPVEAGRVELMRGLGAQAGLVLRNVRLIEELRASRQRLVAAQDEERRKLERNIHDGVQQQLVALTVQLRLAEQLTHRDPERAGSILVDLRDRATEALEDLRDLARGIYPPLLADQGLAVALTAQARKSPVPATVDADGVGRYPQDVEAAIYFSCLEAMNNVAKYAEASSVTIALGQRDGVLGFRVRDDGRGFDPSTTSRGTGLQGIADRLDAIGGAVTITSAPGSGTIVEGTVPVTVQAADGPNDDHASSSRSGPKTAFGM
jgi:signal transduction histidine kinase